MPGSEHISPTNSDETMPDLASVSTASSNPWKVDWESTGGRESDVTGWLTSRDSEAKVECLKTETQEGHCYLWLILYVEAFQEIGIEQFKSLVELYRSECGRLPESDEALSTLLSLCMLHLFPKGSTLSGKSLSIELINHMMSSRVRMVYEDGSCFHIEPADCYSFGCGCSDIYCRHGWSAKFIMTILTQSQKPIGATINFEDIIFDCEEEDHFIDSRSYLSEATVKINGPDSIQVPKPLFTRHPNPLVKPTIRSEPESEPPAQLGQPAPGLKRSSTDPAKGFTSSNYGNGDLMDGFDAISRLANVVRIAVEASKKTGNQVPGERDKDSISSKYMESVKRVVKELSEMGIGPDDSEVDGIGPDDSSSNFGVRRKKQGTYMPNGSILQNGGRDLETIAEDSLMAGSDIQPVGQASMKLYHVHDSSAHNIVQGFMKTDQMLKREKEAVDSIRLINGLACPFKSDRLLVLSHIHTALNTRKIKVEDPNSLSEGLVRVSQSKGRTSSERLLITVVNSTFDIDRMTVSSNAFNLPYIEVGMNISGAMLTKCFVQLSMEYEILWFNEMKGLRVPEFHSRFYSISEDDPNTKSRVGTKSRYSHDGHYGKQKEGKRRSSSLLSFR